MAVEAKRGCGYRKVGGLYIVSGGAGISCHRLPMNIHVCPVCSNGLKYSRGFTWFNPGKFFGQCPEPAFACECMNSCPVCFPPDEKHGLLWIGKKFYSADEFTKEAMSHGVSKRIAAVPNGFEVGKTWIYLAHLEAGEEPTKEKGEDVNMKTEPDGTWSLFKRVPAVFYVFKPTAIEKIVTESQSKDESEMEKLKKRGITPVIVPDDDKDHQGTVHDKEEG